ncbi:phospholipase A2 inhibitor gamma subunit B-like [Spea bombifrons]|uniref:phospholipase A2 inhibitor gamma subunit B-like n=1 Tax=Spea bombifrons TaxID=233779 RepID=UPI002349F3FF|nr:phospholipase A2 inhibitor gamma subunit B-like [Spea bombifrons]
MDNKTDLFTCSDFRRLVIFVLLVHMNLYNMHSCLPVLCLILSLVASGYSLSCIECYSNTGVSCTGPSKICQSNDDVCMSGIFSLGEIGLFGRSCEQDKSSCGVSGSITHNQGTVQLATACCNTDNCSPASLNLPPTNAPKNGFTCSVCNEVDAVKCTAFVTVECTGQEKNCANVVMKANAQSVSSVAGCATESICTFGNQTFNIAGVDMDLEISCSGAISPTGIPATTSTSVIGAKLPCRPWSMILAVYFMMKITVYASTF